MKLMWNLYLALAAGLCYRLALVITQAASAADADGVAMVVPKQILDGSDLGITVANLKPSEVVRIHVLRSLGKWQNNGGEWRRIFQPMHAWAEFAASDAGRLDVDTATPLQGTYTKPDPLALLRTGYRFGDPALKEVFAFPRKPLDDAPDLVYVKLERANSVAAEADFRLHNGEEGMKLEQVNGTGWQAVYARPTDGTNLPAVVILHGSEGGSVGNARVQAAKFAARGFAALAVNYFVYAHDGIIEGVPTKHLDIKLEVIEAAREWLLAQPEVSPDRLALYGVSKGAEFALVAAAQYTWVTHVVAVVPSDIIWEGYLGDGGTSSGTSSWSVSGKPLPYMPLFSYNLSYAPKYEGLYRTNTERYSRSRAFHSDRLTAARIPIEQTEATLLLLACDQDEVWASGAMARNLVEQMVQAKKGDQVTVKIYPKAGHQIAGVGTFPIRMYGDQSSDAYAKDIVAEGEAAADAWKRTIEFLKK